jgi:DNA-binding MarR family transcriptional regulator
MGTLIAILGVLGTVALGLAGYLVSDGQKPLAFKCLIFSLVFYSIDAVLILVNHLNKTPITPQPLFKESARKNQPPIDTTKSPASIHPNNPKLRQAIIRLKALSQHLPKDDLSETYVNDYHALLDVAGAELQQDLTAFRIPQNELRRHVVNIGWEGAHDGWQVTESKELFCPPQVFRIALHGVLDFIESCPPPKGERLETSAEKPKELEAKPVAPEPQPDTADKLRDATQQPSGTNKTKPEPPGLTSEAPQAGDSYNPDKTAVEILKQISRGNAYQSEIANVLRVDPLQVSVRLAQLEQHDYVRIRRPKNRAPYYQITPKGNEFLNQPVRLIPFPTRPAPRVLLYINAHHPDDVDTAILLYMYEEDAPRLLEQISKKFGLNIHEARLRMNRLTAGGYISQVIDPLQRREQYRLRDEGVEYVLWIKPNDA